MLTITINSPYVGSSVRRRALRFLMNEPFCCYCDIILGFKKSPREQFITGSLTPPTLEHVRPKTNGGCTLALACPDCNNARGSLSPDQLRQLADRIEAMERTDQ